MPTPSPSSPLTHFDAQGQAHMVDVGAKAATERTAIAQGRIVMTPATLALVRSGCLLYNSDDAEDTPCVNFGGALVPN